MIAILDLLSVGTGNRLRKLFWFSRTPGNKSNSFSEFIPFLPDDVEMFHLQLRQFFTIRVAIDPAPGLAAQLACARINDGFFHQLIIDRIRKLFIANLLEVDRNGGGFDSDFARRQFLPFFWFYRLFHNVSLRGYSRQRREDTGNIRAILSPYNRHLPPVPKKRS